MTLEELVSKYGLRKVRMNFRELLMGQLNKLVEDNFSNEDQLLQDSVREAFTQALKSDDERKIGAVVFDTQWKHIIGKGYNKPINNLEEYNITLNEDNKNLYTIHAETNAITELYKMGLPYLHNLKMVVVGKFPCICCAKSIIATGIKELWVPPIDKSSKWSEENKQAHELFIYSGIEVNINESLKGVEIGLTCPTKYEE